MIELFMPVGFYDEKKYAAHVLFKQFLGIQYTLKTGDTQNYVIHCQGGRKIIFHDVFFCRFGTGESYLQKSNLPKAPEYLVQNRLTPENDLPIVYGSNYFSENNYTTECGIDVFASVFFMLSRWEEKLIEQKDEHGRTPENLLYSVKYDLHKRPLVDEYTFFLKQLLQKAGITKFKIPSYKAVITHDVDTLYKYRNFTSFLKRAGGDILKRKSTKIFFRTLREYFKLCFGKTADPYDTYNFLTEVSEKYGLKSHFYFIAGKPGELDVKYSIGSRKVQSLIKQIEAEGHIIGIHGSYSSHRDETQFALELERINAYTQKPVNEGRQHFLRFQNPDTWRIWNNCKMKTDSTVGFSNYCGFRAGTSREYPVFDILQVEPLPLHERPLIAMDVALRDAHANPNTALEELAELKETIQKYGGNFVLLWHNSNLKDYAWQEYEAVYEKIIALISR